MQQERRDRFCRDRKMTTGRRDDKAKDILNPGGVTLAEVAAGGAATRWIVLCPEAFHEDESPQMTGYARDLAPMPSSVEMHSPARFRPVTAPSTRRSAYVAGHSRCALVTQVFTAEFDNAVF
jgi:hypothetical protein